MAGLASMLLLPPLMSHLLPFTGTQEEADDELDQLLTQHAEDFRKGLGLKEPPPEPEEGDEGAGGARRPRDQLERLLAAKGAKKVAGVAAMIRTLQFMDRYKCVVGVWGCGCVCHGLVCGWLQRKGEPWRLVVPTAAGSVSVVQLALEVGHSGSCVWWCGERCGVHCGAC